jgi:membrane protein YqaA with SNARE-associated domain
LPISIVALISQTSTSRTVLHWLYHLGGPGLIPLGILDNSVIPVTGSMDVITVLLCANHRDWWPYYVIMATIGAIVGGYITYRLARGEAKSRLGKAVSHGKMKRVKTIFDRWGFWSVIVPAILPPPFPMVPFLIAAGASGYPRGKFIAALAIGRGVRYTILGVLGFLYGRWILTLIRQHVWAIVWIGAALVIGSVTLAFLRLRHESAYAR